MDSNMLLNQAVVNAIAVAVIQYLKAMPWFPWLTKHTDKLNRVTAIVVSGLTSLGVHYTYDHSTGTLVVTGLSLLALKTVIYNWIISFVTQQVIFKATCKSTDPVIVNAPPLQVIATVKQATTAKE